MFFNYNKIVNLFVLVVYLHDDWVNRAANQI